jgi:tetratricopeptide (TPR) repeat protein
MAILSLVLLCVKFRDTWPPARWFIGGFAILLASSSVFPANDLAADRRLYLPLIALAPAIVLALTELHIPRPVWAAVTLALAVLTFARTGVWESELRLWTDAVEKAPDKLRPRIQLARALPPEAALAQLESAAALHPNNVLIAAEKGRIHLQLNRPDLAIADFGQAAALEPGDPLMWNNLGGAFALLGQDAAAQRAFQRALKADPCFAYTRRNLGLKPCR